MQPWGGQKTFKIIKNLKYKNNLTFNMYRMQKFLMLMIYI